MRSKKEVNVRVAAEEEYELESAIADAEVAEEEAEELEMAEQFEEAAPKQESKAHFLAIDEGSSAVKWVSEVGSGSFPSLVMQDVNYINGVQLSPASYSIYTDDFSVLDDTTEAEKTNDEDFQTSLINRVLVHEAIRRAGITEGEVHVVVTLPIKRYYDPEQPGGINHDLIREKQHNIMGEIEAADGRALPKITNVDVLPEGVAGTLLAMEEEELEGTVLGIEIGGYTTDISLLSESGVLQRSTSIPNGTITQAKKLGDTIKRRMGVRKSLPPKLAMKILTTGELPKKWRNVDFSQNRKQLTKDLVEKALNEAEKIADMEFVDHVVVLGGGAYLVDELGYHGPDGIEFVIPEEPEMTNARAVFALSGGAAQ